jgi:hypothetical protein
MTGLMHRRTLFDHLGDEAKRRGRNFEADSQIAIMAENTGATGNGSNERSC